MIIMKIYDEYFKVNGCTDIKLYNNEFSEIDGVLTSGDTNGNQVDIPFEYKTRANFSYDFDSPSSIAEVQKLNSISDSVKLLGSPYGFYVSDFYDAYVIHTVYRNSVISFQPIKMQKNNQHKEDRRVKPSTFLPFSESEILISKRDMKRKSWKSMERYIDENK